MEEFVTTKKHNMPYDKHNYKINGKTSEDMNNINKEDLNEKLKDIKYWQVFLKKYAIKNNIKVTSSSKLFNIFSEEYGTYELDYNSINHEEKVKLIKKIKKIKSNANEDISKCNINPLALPSSGAPALKYGDVNTEITSPGEVKGLKKLLMLKLYAEELLLIFVIKKIQNGNE